MHLVAWDGNLGVTLYAPCIFNNWVVVVVEVVLVVVVGVDMLVVAPPSPSSGTLNCKVWASDGCRGHPNTCVSRDSAVSKSTAHSLSR